MEILNKDLHFMRGDTKTYKLTIQNNTVPIDKIYFTVKDSNKKVMLQKTLNNGIVLNDNTYSIVFNPTDTDTNFDIYTNYVYDIELIMNNVKLTVAKGNLCLDEDVTRPKDEVL